MAKKNPEEEVPEWGTAEYWKIKVPEVEEKKFEYPERLRTGFWRAVADFFLIMWDNVWTTLRRALSGVVEDIFKLFFKEIVTRHSPGIKDYFKKQISVVKLPASVEKELLDRLEDDTPLGTFGLFLFNVLVTGGRFLSILTAVHEVGRQEGYSELMPSLPGLGDIFTASFRDPKYEPVLDDYMKRMGFNVIFRDMLKLVRWTYLNPDQLKQLFLRGEISKSEKNTRLKQLGIRAEDVDSIEKLYYFIPGPSDLVRFSVREAFDEPYIAKYKMMLDYPKVFEEWAKKQGMSKYWAEKFWVSHWVLPSIGQGYEMLHRGEIKEPELASLFKAVDIAPYWRDKLLAISYRPYTRIDIRRMYRTGVVDRKVVKRTYLDLGYDEEHAEKLTAFTVKDALEKERDLTKSEILSIYQRKIIKRAVAKSMITELKYSTEEAEIYLSRIDYDTTKKVKDKELTWIKRNYVGGQISYDEARNRLAKLNLGGDEQSELFRDWDIEREGKMAELTFAQLQTLLIHKIIDERVFKEQLQDKRYTEKQIGWLLELTKKKVVQE